MSAHPLLISDLVVSGSPLDHGQNVFTVAFGKSRIGSLGAVSSF
jgi:hypothetical protein